MASEQDKLLEEVTGREYQYGFHTDIEMDVLPKGLNEDVIREISRRKEEPEFMLEFRLSAYRNWLKMESPSWAHLKIDRIDFQDIIYYAAPKNAPKYNSLDEVDPELLATFEKLGIPLEEQKALSGVAVDAIIDSVSVKTTFRETLAEKGIIFCSISEAIKEHPDLVKKYLGSVVPPQDNYFAALNSAVFSDGSFVLYPRCKVPMDCPPISVLTQ